MMIELLLDFDARIVFLSGHMFARVTIEIKNIVHVAQEKYYFYFFIFVILFFLSFYLLIFFGVQQVLK